MENIFQAILFYLKESKRKCYMENCKVSVAFELKIIFPQSITSNKLNFVVIS